MEHFPSGISSVGLEGNLEHRDNASGFRDLMTEAKGCPFLAKSPCLTAQTPSRRRSNPVQTSSAQLRAEGVALLIMSRSRVGASIFIRE